jgi:hypothetical protein
VGIGVIDFDVLMKGRKNSTIGFPSFPQTVNTTASIGRLQRSSGNLRYGACTVLFELHIAVCNAGSPARCQVSGMVSSIVLL